MYVLGSTPFYCTLLWLSFSLLDYSTHGSTWLYYTLSTTWYYLTLLGSNLLYHGSTWIYITPLHFTMALAILGSTWCNYTLYLVLPCMVYLNPITLYISWHYTWLHNSIQWLYFGLLDSTTVYCGSVIDYTLPRLYLVLLSSPALYYSSAWFYLTLLHSIMAVLGSIWLYYSLPWLWLTELDSSLTVL